MIIKAPYRKRTTRPEGNRLQDALKVTKIKRGADDTKKMPILLPIARQLGIDPVHFGLVMVLNLMIGLLHPPMGMVLFVLARVAKLSVERTTMAILPWLVPLLGSLIVLTYVPSISMWLPRMMGL